MSLAAQVLLGLVAGVAVGVFAGELVSPLGVVGRAFILLLQMTVLPYVVVSLIRGLGSLSAKEAIDLARKAGGFLLVLWGIALLAVVLIPVAFPDWTSASFFSTTLVEPPPDFDLLGLFIPANPFEALSRNVVPSVVVFSVALGIALIQTGDSAPVVRALGTLTDALGSITGWVVRLAPIGVFAIAAEAAGTLDVDQLEGLQVYVAVYAAVALFLALWVLPGLVTTLTPFRYREVIGMTRDALVTAFATGNLFVVLSVLSEKSKELVRLRGEGSEEAESFVEVVVPTAFALPSAGKLLALSFPLFAGWMSGFAVPLVDYPLYLVSGLLSFFGSTLVAVPFMLDLFRVPVDTFQLFVIVDNVVGGRFGSLLAAVHILVLSLLAASAAGGLIRLRWARLSRYLIVTVAAGAALLLGIRFGFELIGHPYQGYRLFIQRGLLDEGVPARLLDAPPSPLPEVDLRVPTLERIHARGVLRVGYRRDTLPEAFQNEAGELVGLDVELMHHLARAIGVRLEFVRVDAQDLPRLLSAGYLDIGTGIAVTPQALEQVALSATYIDHTLAFIVPDHRRTEFSSRRAVKALPSLRLAIPPVPYYEAKVRAYLPQAELVGIDSPRPFFRGEVADVDALVFSAEAGSAWCLIYPAFGVAVPQPDVLRVPFAFPVARGDVEMLRFLDRWIELKQRDRTVERLFDYWIRGRAQQTRRPRWSVIRDVLHWVD